MPWSNKTVVFDLDGTLVDTAPDLHASLAHCYGEIGLRTVDLPTIRHCIGHGAKAMILKSAEYCGYDLPEATVETLFRSFLDYYIAHIADLSQPFDGIVECLDYCKARGAKLSVCTNKTQILAEEVLNALDLAKYFDSVVGADKASIKKPSPQHIKEAVGLADGLLESSVMIGDSSTDGFAAQSARIPFVLMSYGYLDDRLNEVDCAYTLSSARDLPAALEGLFSRAS